MSRRAARNVGVDVAALFVMLAVAVPAFAPAFGGTGWAVAGFGGVVLGTALGWAGARLRWPVVTVGAAAVAAYVVLGGALALPETTVAGVVPTTTTLLGLLSGVVTGWKQVITVTPPVGDVGEAMVVPLLSGLVCALVAVSVALRSRRWWALALVPPVALLTGAILLGTQQPELPVLQGISLVLVALVWSTWRRSRAERRLGAGGVVVAAGAGRAALLRRGWTAAAVLGAAVLAAVALGPAAAPSASRVVLRDAVQPPFDPLAYPSPLSGYRAYVKDLDETPLLTVDGLPAGARIRIATLDTYDGVVFDVAGGRSASGSGTFERVGGPVTAPAGTPARVHVQVEGYRGVWLPTVGMPTAFHLDGTGADPDALYYNRSSGTAVLTSGLDEGDEYALDVVVPDQPTEEEVAQLAPGSVVLPEAENVPDPLRQKAAEMVADATTPGEQALALESALTLGYFSDGLEGQTASRAGHGADRLAALLTADQMVGDDEQYAAAMALMARQLGLPSRVVMGFVPERSGPAGPVTVTGADVAAWVEVAFDGVGWVTFDPTPDEDRVPQQQSPKPRSTPQPQVQQPPPPPEEPPQPPPESADDLDDEGAPEDEAGLDVPWLLLAAVGLPLLALLVPVLVVLWLKARRRRRRFARGTPAQRIAGGWAEVVDAVRDLGGAPPARATRRETATTLTGVDGAVVLAERADAGVFAPGEPTEEEVARYWADVRTAVHGAGAAVGPWRRLRGRLSPRSLRRHR